MSITNELREYALLCDEPTRKSLNVIADGIDEAHEREVYAAQSSAVFMPNHRISMPLDADDMPIDLGDEVVFASGEPEDHFTVDAFWLDLDGWHVSGEFDAMPSELRHWEAPTVENVLREFTDAILEWAGKSGTVAETGMWSDVASEYAERIREAVEHE